MFADVLILAIIRFIRREYRKATAARWNVAGGKILRYTTKGSYQPLPLLDYSYEVNGTTEDGSATGFSSGNREIKWIGDKMDALSTLRVRYNPAVPYQSRILNEDNPQIPFEIDHNVR